jgi:predicted Ser/Thr protein kinase
MTKTRDSTNACPKCGARVPPEAPQGLCPQCVLAAAAAAEPAPTATSEIPSLERLAVAFPQLQVIELIGRGAMGFVFKARQPHLDRFVALKLLPDSLARDAHFAERFNREGRTLARLNHPNIVSIFDFGEAGGFYFLLMEYVDGVNLRQAMQAGKFSPSEALTIVPKICAALQFAHDEGVLHRDIKPENILLDAKGRVKIADFGIAKIIAEKDTHGTLTGTGAAIGTPQYMAPEQFEKPGSVDHRADIYSLGVVFYEMLTGELPLGRFAPPSQRTPVDPRFDDVVMRTLEKEREKRFQSAGEVKTNVEHLTETGAGNFQGAPLKVSADAPRTPGGTMVIPSATPAIPGWSWKAVVGAVLVGISLLPAFAIMGYVLTHTSAPGGFAIWAVFVMFAVGFLPGLAGTILGWMGLSDIRAHEGKRRGLPLAVFAALAWPLFLLLSTTLVVPFFIAVPGGDIRGAPPSPRFLLLLIPAGTFTFAIWAVRAVSRWGANMPADNKRGVLKWIFAGLTAAGLGFALLSILPASTRRSEGGLGRSTPFPPDYVTPVPAQPTQSAARENWMPNLTPDEKPNLAAIATEAKNLTASGRYEDALQRYLWYHHHALEYDPAQAGVRLSFALSDWMELARRYPKARQALIEIRDEGARKFSTGAGYFALFMEVAAINRELGEQDSTSELFQSIRTRDPKLAAQCYNVAEDLLVEKGEYALCASFIPNFQGRFEQIRRTREQMLEVADRTPSADWTPVRKQAEAAFIKDTRKLIEILVGVGRKAEAGQIQVKALRVLNVPELQSALPDAEQQVAKHSSSVSNSKQTVNVVAAGAPPLSYQWYVPESKMVIDVRPFDTSGLAPSNEMTWAFTSIIPPNHEAQFLFVRWANDVPSIQEGQSGYFKVGAAPAEVAFDADHDKHGPPQPAAERSQWNVNLGLGFTASTFRPEDPPYRRIDPPKRMSVRSGYQRRIPLVEFGSTNNALGQGRGGIDLRILVRPLQSPAIRTLPSEKEHGHYVSGRGFIGTRDEVLKALKEMPIDP